MYTSTFILFAINLQLRLFKYSFSTSLHSQAPRVVILFRKCLTKFLLSTFLWTTDDVLTEISNVTASRLLNQSIVPSMLSYAWLGNLLESGAVCDSLPALFCGLIYHIALKTLIPKEAVSCTVGWNTSSVQNDMSMITLLTCNRLPLTQYKNAVIIAVPQRFIKNEISVLFTDAVIASSDHFSSQIKAT